MNANPLSRLFDAIIQAKMDDKKKEIEYELLRLFSRIGMDKPSNFQDILDFVFDDVNETADSENWHDGDVAIAFRRWIEEQANKGYVPSAI